MSDFLKSLLDKNPGSQTGELIGAYLSGRDKKDNRARNVLLASLFFNAKEASMQSKVRKNLSDLKHPKIGLPGLGTFVIRTGKLKNKIKRHKDILGNLEKNTYKGYEKHVAVKEKLKQMEDLLKVVEKNIKIKKQFKNENK